jgi:hypothetical protein
VRAINIRTQDFVWAPQLKWVPGKDAAVHLICWCIRMATPPMRAESCKSRGGSRTRPADINELLGQIFGNVQPTCAICNHDADESQALIRYAGCEHKVVHKCCAQMWGNVERKYTCIVCKSDDVGDAKLRAWFRAPETRTLTRTPVVLSRKNHDEHEAFMAQLDTMPTFEAVIGRTAARLVCDNFERRKAQQSEPAFDTVARRITQDLKLNPLADPNGDAYCILGLLRKLAYSADDILTFRFTLPMIVHNPGNVAILLDRTYFKAAQLTRAPLNVTFVKLLLAGVDVGQITNAGYTRGELVSLKFSVPAFLCAGGTQAELRRLNVSEGDLYSMFDYCSLVEDLWRR